MAKRKPAAQPAAAIQEALPAANAIRQNGTGYILLLPATRNEPRKFVTTRWTPLGPPLVFPSRKAALDFRSEWGLSRARTVKMRYTVETWSAQGEVTTKPKPAAQPAAPKLFRVTVPVERATGQQIYEIPAASLADAKRVWAEHGDDYECVAEELEVQRVGEPEFEEMEPEFG